MINYTYIFDKINSRNAKHIRVPKIFRMIKWRRTRWEGHVARVGEMRVSYRVLVGKPQGKRLRGRPRRRWEHNIKVVLQEWDVGVWTGWS
jgi:hypothetical protein